MTVKQFSTDGVEWTLYYGAPNYLAQWDIKYRIHQAIMRSLFYADIDVAQRRMNITMQCSDLGGDGDDIGWLRRAALFEGLSSNERAWLAAQAREQLRLAGQAPKGVRAKRWRANRSTNRRSLLTASKTSSTSGTDRVESASTARQT